MKIAIIVNVGKVGKEESSNIAELASFLSTSVVVNDLSLFKQQRGAHCFIVTIHRFDEAMLPEKLANAENNRATLIQQVDKWPDEGLSPEKIEERDEAKNTRPRRDKEDTRHKTRISTSCVTQSKTRTKLIHVPNTYT